MLFNIINYYLFKLNNNYITKHKSKYSELNSSQHNTKSTNKIVLLKSLALNKRLPIKSNNCNNIKCTSQYTNEKMLSKHSFFQTSLEQTSFIASHKNIKPSQYKQRNSSIAMPIQTTTRKISSIYHRKVPKSKSLDYDNHKYNIPVINQKEMVQNVIPKDNGLKYEPNPFVFLHTKVIPLIRNQRKNDNNQIDGAFREIDCVYNMNHPLVPRKQFAPPFRLIQDVFTVEIEKANKPYKEKRRKDYEDVYKKQLELKLEAQRQIKANKELNEKRKRLFAKFRRVIIKAVMHFKRLYKRKNVSDYFEDLLESNNVSPRNICKDMFMKFKQAIWDNDIDLITKIMNKYPNIMHKTNVGGQSPIHLVAKRNNVEVLSMFIKKGGNINMQDCVGNTPLHLASREGNVEVIQLLLYEFALPSLLTIEGKKPSDQAKNSVIRHILKRAEIVS